MLKINNIIKSYDKHIALNNVSLNIPKGTIFGLLGPNGAGKTSLIRIITNITKADEGEILFDGHSMTSKLTSHIGYMPEERGLYKKMTVGNQLMYLAQLKDMSKKEAKKALRFWMQRFDIEDWWDKKIDELSKGMQQKIQFIATVVHNPKLLILDEPFSGLDPINTNLFKDEILRLKDMGATIIFSTHRMEQVEELCEGICLINNGENILEGKVKEIKNSYREGIYILAYDGLLGSKEKMDILEEKEGHIKFKLKKDVLLNETLSDVLTSHSQLLELKEVIPTLNQIFINRVQENQHQHQY